MNPPVTSPGTELALASLRDEGGASVRWFVELKGNPYDLEDLCRFFREDQLRVERRGAGFVLRSSKLDASSEACEVKTGAERLLVTLNGVALLCLHGFEAVQMGNLIFEDEQGREHVVHFYAAEIDVRMRLSAEPSGGRPAIGRDQMSLPARWADLANRNQDIEKALRVWAGPRTWQELYKIVEIVLGDVGSNIWECGWCEETEVDLLKQTSNSSAAVGDQARHAHPRFKPPPRPMSLPEAEMLVARILRGWLAAKAEEELGQINPA